MYVHYGKMAIMKEGHLDRNDIITHQYPSEYTDVASLGFNSIAF